MILSLRGAFYATKQSPNQRGDCFAIARNDMWAKVNALREFALTPALSRRERGYAVCVDAGYFR